MRPTERQSEIVDLIKVHGTLSVEVIARRTRVSAVTIRRDLEQLERAGAIRRVHGGAMVVDATPSLLLRHYAEHAVDYPRHKAAIGRLAASLIGTGATVIIDAGTTTLELARHLQGKQQITVVATAINIAEQLENMPGITTMLTGGTVRSRVNSLINPLLEQSLSQVYADHVFFGLYGLDLARGVTTRDFAEADVKRLLIRAGRQVIALADHSKLGRVMPAFIAPVQAIHTLITDAEADPACVRALEEAGIRVLLAPLEPAEVSGA